MLFPAKGGNVGSNQGDFVDIVQQESNAYNRLYIPAPSKIADPNLSRPRPQARHNHEIEPLRWSPPAFVTCAVALKIFMGDI